MSKKLIEEAAMICSACASYGVAVGVSRIASELYGVTPYEAMDNPAAKLAVRTWSAANVARIRAGAAAHTNESMRDDYAEAEAMLRNGEIKP